MRGSEGFTDKQGRSWLPDPTGRFTFRCMDGDRWTPLVCMAKRQTPGEDPEGAALLEAGIGASLAPDDPRTDPAPGLELRVPEPKSPDGGWDQRVVGLDFSDLEQWLVVEGLAGWEVVAVLRADGLTGVPDTELVVVVKRPRTGDVAR